jgi:CRP-like cAMP-binding protein
MAPCVVYDSLKPDRHADGERGCSILDRSPASRRTLQLRSTTPPSQGAIQNRLLASLPSTDRDHLIATLDVVPLTLRDLLHKPGEPVDYVYFPGGGFCSIVTVLKNGNMVEVATVGREGAVGLSALLKTNFAASATIVQGDTDTCYRMTAERYRHEMAKSGPFHELMTRFMQAFLAAIMQSTACNAVHKVEHRLARWLLMAHDRMGTDEFPLTQEFVAMMLGATRPTVTVVAGVLQKAGLITYHRGRVAILDRERLEAASCECYGAVTNLLRAVTAPPGQTAGSL